MTLDANSEALDRRRRQLRFRCWHRGTREADLLLGSFADAHLDGFGAAELDALDALLENGDPDIYDWMTGRETVPDAFDTPVMRLLMQHRLPPATGS